VGTASGFQAFIITAFGRKDQIPNQKLHTLLVKGENATLGMRNKEISFDFNNKRKYISFHFRNEECRNGILIQKRSTVDLECYFRSQIIYINELRQYLKSYEKW
jgi:hypothetical protein